MSLVLRVTLDEERWTRIRVRPAPSLAEAVHISTTLTSTNTLEARMPHGPTTPLGRQLRSVLTSLRTCTASGFVFPRDHSVGATGHGHSSVNGRSTSSAAAAVAHRRAADEDRITAQHGPSDGQRRDKRFEDGKATVPDNTAEPPHIRRCFKRKRISSWTRVDRISEALKDAGRLDLLPKDTRALGRSDVSHVNVWSRNGHVDHKINAERHRSDPIPTLENAQELRLSRILASYIQYLDRRQGTAEAAWSRRFELTLAEHNLLKSHGFSIADVRDWARILKKANPVSLAILLKMRIKNKDHGVSSIPFFVILYILRRQHISRAALSKLIPLIESVLDYRTGPSVRPGSLSSSVVFLAFVRLIRHARVVWLQGTGPLTDMLIKFLPRCFSKSRSRSSNSLQILTYQLNKAMRLLSLPASVSPFRYREHQERAIIRILQFMAEHEPSIDLNREGYRAVVAVQLGQRKSARDRQWAELKSLSWPPWKSERTAMDAYITHETHGTPKAADTLRRLQGAGYGRQDWEAAASISTGWDTDNTPTTQTRALLPVGIGRNMRFSGGGANAWAARITATRTAQEAWACYLAYENDLSLRAKENGMAVHDKSADQHVLLAIFKKLHYEDQRLAGKSGGGSGQKPQGAKQYAGDSLEMGPPPPSIHQHTYTSRPIPSLHDFYHDTVAQGCVLKDHCLAFAVANASSLSHGLEYILDSTPQRPELRGLLDLDGHRDLSTISQPLLTAFLKLLGRFSRVPLPVALSELKKRSLLAGTSLDNIRRQVSHAHNPLTLAIELLHRTRPSRRPAWNAVLVSLSHESSHHDLWHAESRSQWQFSSEEENRAVGSMAAYRLFQKTLAMMRETHLDLDATGLRAWCNAVENAVLGYWLIMQNEEFTEVCIHEKPYVPEFDRLIRVLNRDLARMETAFARMVGYQNFQGESDEKDSLISEPQFCQYFDIPSPALVHAYIRALGWMADYDGLLIAVKWMVKYRYALQKHREYYRNGEVVMRRALIALRVFLERRWLEKVLVGINPGRERKTDGAAGELDTMQRTRQLQRLHISATDELINETRVLVDWVEDWGGWPTDQEVEEYCRNERFLRVRK